MKKSELKDKAAKFIDGVDLKNLMSVSDEQVVFKKNVGYENRFGGAFSGEISVRAITFKEVVNRIGKNPSSERKIYDVLEELLSSEYPKSDDPDDDVFFDAVDVVRSICEGIEEDTTMRHIINEITVIVLALISENAKEAQDAL